MAFSFTGDLGCEFGPSLTSAAGWYQQGVSCHGNTKDPNSLGSYAQFVPPSVLRGYGRGLQAGRESKQSFIGFMIYNRFWWKKDHDGLTIGYGQINNPGRYLALVPAINGETATSDALGSPYWPGNPSDPFKPWDSSITYDYMPVQWLTWRFEYDYRHSSVPYWAGHGGSTPPSALGSPTGVNNGSPTLYSCMDGTPAPLRWPYVNVPGFCGGESGHGGLWQPDMRRSGLVKPGSTSCRAWNVRIISPAPTSSTSAIATCATTRTPRARCRSRLSLSERPPARRLREIREPAYRNAGSRPNKMPEQSETASANPSARASSAISSRRGRFPGPIARRPQSGASHTSTDDAARDRKQKTLHQ